MVNYKKALNTYKINQLSSTKFNPIVFIERTHLLRNTLLNLSGTAQPQLVIPTALTRVILVLSLGLKPNKTILREACKNVQKSGKSPKFS